MRRQTSKPEPSGSITSSTTQAIAWVPSASIAPPASARGHDAEVLDGEEVGEQRDDLRVVLDQQHGGHAVSLAPERARRTRFPRMFIFGTSAGQRRAVNWGHEAIPHHHRRHRRRRGGLRSPRSPTTARPPQMGSATFETCLRAHGIPVPAGLKAGRSRSGSARTRTPPVSRTRSGLRPEPGRQPADRGRRSSHVPGDKGLNPPADVDELKPWILQQSQTAAGNTALKACGFAGAGGEACRRGRRHVRCRQGPGRFEGGDIAAGTSEGTDHADDLTRRRSFGTGSAPAARRRGRPRPPARRAPRSARRRAPRRARPAPGAPRSRAPRAGTASRTAGS